MGMRGLGLSNFISGPRYPWSLRSSWLPLVAIFIAQALCGSKDMVSLPSSTLPDCGLFFLSMNFRQGLFPYVEFPLFRTMSFIGTIVLAVVWDKAVNIIVKLVLRSVWSYSWDSFRPRAISCAYSRHPYLRCITYLFKLYRRPVEESPSWHWMSFWYGQGIICKYLCFSHLDVCATCSTNWYRYVFVEPRKSLLYWALIEVLKAIRLYALGYNAISLIIWRIVRPIVFMRWCWG